MRTRPWLTQFSCAPNRQGGCGPLLSCHELCTRARWDATVSCRGRSSRRLGLMLTPRGWPGSRVITFRLRAWLGAFGRLRARSLACTGPGRRAQFVGWQSRDLGEHRRLVRSAIADQGGHEVDTQGDGFFVAFASAKQAVLCALEIQRALAALSGQLVRRFGSGSAFILAMRSLLRGCIRALPFIAPPGSAPWPAAARCSFPRRPRPSSKMKRRSRGLRCWTWASASWRTSIAGFAYSSLPRPGLSPRPRRLRSNTQVSRPRACRPPQPGRCRGSYMPAWDRAICRWS